MAGQVDVGLPDGQFLARGQPQLFTHDVDTGDQFGHRMLDLHPGVDLQEGEVVRFGVDDELHRPGTDVVQGVGEFERGLVQAGTHRRGHHGRRCLLHHLLVPPLRGAVPLTEVDDTAVPVGEDLDLHVPGAGDETFDEHPAVTERLLRLAAGRGEPGVEILGFLHQDHAAATSSGGGLEQYRESDRDGHLPGLLHTGQRLAAGADRYAERAGHGPGRHLVPAPADGRRVRSDEDDAVGGTGLGQFGPFGQEPVAGVQRVASGQQRGGDHPVDVEVAVW